MNFCAVLFNFDNNSLKNIEDIFHYVSEYMRISINYSMFSIVLKKSQDDFIIMKQVAMIINYFESETIVGANN